MFQSPATQRSRDQRWVIFGACLTQFTVIGLLFSYGLFIKVFETEFGWSRTLLSSCISLAFFMMGVLAIFAGRLSDRFGPRIVLSITGLIYGLGYVLLSRVNAPWQMFLVFGLFVSAGLCTHDVVTLGTIARWFPRRRGIMSGIVKVGTAVGQIILPLLTAYLIIQFGWQQALVILGCLGAALLLISALSMKNPPTEPNAPLNISLEGFSFQEARRTHVLWILCAIQFLFFPSLMTIPLHIVVHGIDLGMTPAMAAALLSAIGFSSVAGRLAIGRLADVIGGKRSMIVCFVPLIASISSLVFIDTYWILFTAIAVYGFGHGGLFTIVSPTIAEIFGLRAHGAIFGLVLFFGTIGGALGPVVAGRIFDVTGSYDFAFGSLAALAALGLVLVLLLPSTSPNR